MHHAADSALVANCFEKKSPYGILPFLKEAGIMLMSAKPREYLPSWQSENFCQVARKTHVTTFLWRA